MRRCPALLVAVAVAAASLASAGSGDPLRERQYGLEVIGAPEAWTTSAGADTIIAIVDTGIQLDHPDLAPKLLRDRDGDVVGFDAVDGRRVDDGHGHGTLVAGTAAAAADNGIGIASVAPRARLMPVRVLDDRGAGSLTAIDRGIRWAVDNGADVINLSLESSVPLPGQIISGGPDAAVRYAWEHGVAVVAAAGNSGTPFTDYRSSTPVLLVGATDARDRQTSFSDSGRRDMVLAPGDDIVSTACDPCGPGGTPAYASASGTSFAAPHVAGAIAVLLAQGRSASEAVAALRETAVTVPRPATSIQQGHGRIDLAAAVRWGEAAPARSVEEQPTPSTTPTPPPTSSTERAPAPGAGGTASPPEGSATPARSPAPAEAIEEPQDAIEAPQDAGAVDPAGPGTTDAEDPRPARGDDPRPAELTSSGPESAPPDAVATPGPDAASPALVLFAGSLVIATAAASLHALGRRPQPR